ncbi:MAG: amidohydrolase family protein [Firmicutes bacterium]|nr:amidohydrolase family protein [Bacillota bacterium]
MLDVLIINGTYPDFGNYKTGANNSGSKMVKGNIGLKDGSISYVGEGEPEAKEVFDAHGLVVSPGFIDIHMHEENFLKEGKKCITSKHMLEMGVTTAVGGNCGTQRQDIHVFKSTIQDLGGAPINYMAYTGYNFFRTGLGFDHHEITGTGDRVKIRDLLMKEIEQGACGVSFGIEYDPAMTFDEMLFAVGDLQNPNYIVSAHYRDEDHINTDNVDEMIRFSREIVPKFQISHLSSGAAFGKMNECLDHINKAMALDPGLNYDTYPYNAFSTYIGSTVFEDGCLETWGVGYDSILLTGDPYRNTFCTEEIFKDARKNYPDMLAVAFVMNEDAIREAIVNPNGMVASDGVIAGGHGHPRVAGTFPRVLGKYVREEEALPLVLALRKITLEPAERMNLKKKGRIVEGGDGDLTIFDPNSIIDKADFMKLEPPAGIKRVYLAGEIALDEGSIIKENLGSFIPFDIGN